ncbi:Hook-filament junction protein [Listeria grayi]|uniref:Flagellar hook-associated protein 3 n=3 Tax=Listeria grayi TaxID=1641 RepID=D7V0F6_LISGR|nr:flagellar hook-associated protein 3 [Listeria grayi]EFI83049.1 flagellar hook-associated protein 3 [Listeria grayi DSM 20601]EUJ29042.1 flagellar hook-associated protein FlgL [Listeria grayi FSL F6-1183]MBC1921250.1 flagellar hook-associated protein 3 [Listeria grayi]STY43946.1 Hook-filament junction protein [Listeria grayi]VEI35453.1 Hook-filament junction protein [Listeria grayi]
MRIATNQQTNTIINQINNANVLMGKYQTQVSTGKRYETMSENPAATTQVLSYNHILNQLNREQKDVSDAKSLLTSADTSLSSMNDAMSRINAIVLQSLNGTTDEKNMNQAAEEVKGLLQSLVSLGNTDDDGRYIFSGSSTNTKPFTINSQTGVIAYNGTTDNKNFKVSDSHEVEVYHDGSQLTQIFNTINQIVQAMQSGDKDSLRGFQEQNEANLDILSNKMTSVGGQKNSVLAYDNILSSKIIDYKDRKSKVDEVDGPEAISNLNQASIAYQASLKSSVIIQQLSILNYM